MSEVTESVRAVESESDQKQKRTGDSEESDSSVAKKSKPENDRNPEAIGSDEARSEGENREAVVKKLGFEIEADVAEDKGSRHTMEDASVLLFDSDFDSSSKFRFLFLNPTFFFVFCFYIYKLVVVMVTYLC